MAFFSCESFDFDFEGVIYDKEYAEFFPQLQI